VKALVEALEPLEYVHALWEGGAVGFGRLDEWSDIDVCVDVEDERVEEVFKVVEKTLESLSPVESAFEVPSAPHGHAQKFYRLEKTSKYMIVDLAVMKHSAKDKFLEEERHGKAVFHFNKDDAVKVPSLESDELMEDLKSRFEKTKNKFDMFQIFVQKELNRGNLIEAIEIYQRFILESLVHALRIIHKPVRHEYRTRYVHYDFPPDVLDKLEELYFVKDGKDLKAKYETATQWFLDTVRVMDYEDVERGLTKSIGNDI
jgi:predicted nucleotidyltransferase